MEQLPNIEAREKTNELLMIPFGKTLEQTDNAKQERRATLKAALGR